MLFGEHAVLRGYPAMVCAVDHWIHVQLIPHDQKTIKIISDKFGEYQTNLTTLTMEPPFEFILTAIHSFKEAIHQGFELHIQSDFSPQWGLGSSAAVTAATMKVLAEYTQQDLNQDTLFERSLAVIRDVQKIGSGADLAASIFGGTLCYQTTPSQIQPINFNMPLSLVYCGYKTPTVEVIAKVNEDKSKTPDFHRSLFQTMGECAQVAIDAVNEPQQLSKAMKSYQGLQTALGVCTPDLADLIMKIESYPDILAAKISGSGLGDCIVALGKLPPEAFSTGNIKQLDIDITPQGVTLYE